VKKINKKYTFCVDKIEEVNYTTEKARNVTLKEGDHMNLNKMAERLTTLRGDKSRTEVAAALGISYSALSAYETGHRIPRDEVKIAIAKYYCKPVTYIFFDQ